MTPPPEHSTQTWTQIHRLLDLLDSAESSELGSIREVMGRLVSCIKVCEYVAKEQQEYYALKDEMEETFAKLHSHLSWDISLATTASCKCICRSITSTLEKIERCIELQALLEWQGVSKYYKEIQGHLQQLTLNTDRMIWRTDRPNNRFKIPQGPLVDRTQYDSSTRVLVSEYSLGSTQNFVLDRIHNWIQNPRKKGDTTYWLNGMAGTGKTVVAYWLCEQLKSSCVLAASFFCSRSFPECQDARSIIPSIISQLALFSYPYQCVLARILVEGLHAHSGPLEKQFDTLIAKPLYEIQKTLVAPPVVVIDALDECENKEIVCELIQTLLAQPPTLPLMFVLSSRPELEIRDQFSDRGGWSDDGAWISLDDQPMSNMKQDVLKYLQVRLNPLGLPESQLESLAQRAGVWFTYAAALARYIDSGEPHQPPSLRADKILHLSDQTKTTKLQEIDELYAHILHAVFTNRPKGVDAQDMHQVLKTVICAQEPISVQTMGDLLGMNCIQRAYAVLRPFSSVLNVKGASQPIVALHPSLIEYLVDPSRSHDYYCDTATHHILLARRCFDFIRDSKLLFNISQLESSYKLDNQVPNLKRRVEESISPEMLYVCHHWAAHLHLSLETSSLQVRLEEFLTNYLLLWLEVLNLTDNIPDGPTMITMAEQWAIQHSSSAEVIRLAKAASRFVTAFATNPVAESTPHIYVSMIPSLPLSDPVRELYGAPFILLAQRSTGGQVYSATFSPDGTKVALGTGNDVQLVDTFSGRLLAESFKGHSWSVMSVAFSPDGSKIASGSRDKTIRLWDSQSGKLILSPLIGHFGHVRTVVFSPSGTTLVSSSNDSTIRVWDVQSGQPKLRPLRGHDGYVKTITVSSNSRIISGSQDGTIRVWDLHTGHLLLGPLTGHTDYITSVSLSPDNTQIVSGSADRTIRIWDSESGEALFGPLLGHNDWVLSVAFTTNGAHVISGSSDCSVRVWDAATGKLLKKLPHKHESHVFSVACSPDGSHFVSGSGDETVCLWKSHRYPISMKSTAGQTALGHSNAIHSIAVCPKGIYLASGSSDMSICMWNLQQKSMVLGPLEGHTGAVNSLCFSPEGSLLVSGSSDGTIRVWNSQTGATILDPLKEEATEINTVACSKGSDMIVSGASDGTVSIWSTTGERVLGPLTGHGDSIQSADFSFDDSRIVTGSMNKTICVWDVQSGNIILGPFSGHAAGIRTVSFSPNDSIIASGSDDRTIRLWDAQTGQPIRPPLIHADRVRSLQFSSDGNQIVSGVDDSTIRIWNPHSGSMILEPLRGHIDSVNSVAFLPDGTQVVSASSDKVIRVWDIKKRPLQDPMSNFSRWRMNVHGWVVDSYDPSKRLAWLNPRLRASILSPRNIALFSKEGQVELDFNGASIGKSWTDLKPV